MAEMFQQQQIVESFPWYEADKKKYIPSNKVSQEGHDGGHNGRKLGRVASAVGRVGGPDGADVVVAADVLAGGAISVAVARGVLEPILFEITEHI